MNTTRPSSPSSSERHKKTIYWYITDARRVQFNNVTAKDEHSSYIIPLNAKFLCFDGLLREVIHAVDDVLFKPITKLIYEQEQHPPSIVIYDDFSMKVVIGMAGDKAFDPKHGINVKTLL